MLAGVKTRVSQLRLDVGQRVADPSWAVADLAQPIAEAPGSLQREIDPCVVAASPGQLGLWLTIDHGARLCVDM
jgi:hypothetical protein